MSKEEIQKSIYECKNDEDIERFVQERIRGLEDDSEEVTIGQNYTDTFEQYISSKVHYKPAAKFEKGECPDLVYDDMEPYVSLIKGIRRNPWYNELTLFTSIFWELHRYLPNSEDIGIERYLTYHSHIDDGKISIKDIKAHDCAFCSEKSGLSHNMFKLLGIDSSLVSGERDNTAHAYNIIFPNGYGNKPAVIFDPSHHIDFVNEEGKKTSAGYYKALSEEEYEKMKNGESVSLDMARSGEKIKELYGGVLDGYEMQVETPSYSIGFGKTKLQKKEAELASLEKDEKDISQEENIIDAKNQKQGEQVGE